MSRRSRLRDLVSQATLAERDLERERIRAARDSQNFATGVGALRSLVPGIAGLYGDSVKRDEDKKEKLRLEGREDDALLKKLAREEQLAKIKADAQVKAAQEKARGADAKARAEVEAKEAKAAADAENARGAKMAGALYDNEKALEKDDAADEERATAMGDALKGVKNDLDDPDFADRAPPEPLAKSEELLSKAELNRAKAERERAKAKGGTGPSAKDKAREAKDAAAKAKDTREDADSLRNEYLKLPEVKAFTEVKMARDKVKTAAANPSAAGDITLVFALMKANDPTSTVREGEFAAAAKAGGFGEQVKAQIERIDSGQLLTPSQRQDFVNQVESFYSVQKAQADEAMKRYDAIASRRGIDTRDVTGTAPPSAVSEMTPEQRRARLAELRAKRGAQ